MESLTRKNILTLYPKKYKSKIDYLNLGDEEILTLKPIELVSDNEIYELSEILSLEGTSVGKSTESLLETILDLFSDTTQSKYRVPLFKFLNAVDILRSRGYALPSFGYTVEQLTQENVYKILEPDNCISSEYILGKPINPTSDHISVIVDTGLKRKGNRSKDLEALLSRR